MNITVLSESKLSVYEAVTAQIIGAIEAGAGVCRMPWQSGIVQLAMPTNAATDMPYHGVNVVALWAQAMSKQYVTGHWASYQQWRKLGAQVRAGERGSLVIFYKDFESDPGDQTNADADRPRFVIRSSHVFNADQVDGWEFPQNPRASQVEIDEMIEAFVYATKADVRHGSPIACYRRREDYIDMPSPERFIGTPTSSPTEAYYAVLLHELTHYAER